MDHESAVERLYDLERGQLDEPARSALEAHLEDCSECQGILEVVRAIGSEHRDVCDHPTSDEIVTFVYEPERLAEQDRDAIEQHISGCASCTSDVSTVRTVEASAQEGGPTHHAPQWWRSTTVLATAASILIAVLGYAGYLGLYRLPRTQDTVAHLREETARL